ALFHESGYLPTLIAGDYNDWRNTLGKHRFHLHHFEQVTAPIKRFRSFPAFFAVAALDKVYRRGAVKVHEAKVVRNVLSRKASDHLPLVVDFSLDGHATAHPNGGH